MYDPVIFKEIQILSYIMDDVKECETDLAGATDPAQQLELKDELRSLVTELDDAGFRCIDLLSIYLDNCKLTGDPVNLSYYKTYVELKKSASMIRR